MNIVTYNNFTIDGHIRQGYYTDEELEENRIESFSPGRCSARMFFADKKGKKLPGSFHIVLLLPPSDIENSLRFPEAGIGEQIQGLYLNIRYEDGALYCVTGTSLNFLPWTRP